MALRTIHILPEQVASQIAAGEVVERPASAIKELVENSLDAGAHSIAVEIEQGGAALIVVADDGCGMSREDALLSLRRHATSKVREVADLTAIRTFGFRGEALASVASIAELRMQTRRPNDDCGIELLVSGGDVEQTRECPLAPGSRIEVRKLFFNTPARLKFMKTVPTEQAAAAEVLQRLALANRRVTFRFAADGRVIFELPRVASLLERMRHLYGAKLAERMLPFDHRSGSIEVHGLTSMSQESLAAPRLIFTYVNNRPVRDRMLMRAIARAYETLLPRGRHPAAALFVDLPPEEVDVNVHPMKTEVRFRRGGQIFELVYSVLRERLKDQTNAMPNALVRVSDPSPAEAPPPSSSSMSNNGGQDGIAPQPVSSSPLPSFGTGKGKGGSTASERPLRLITDATVTRAAQVPLGLGFARANDDSRDSNAASAGRPVPRYSSLRVVGQLFAGYIALEGDDGLILIDQHAAHERVTFERLRGELRAGGIRVQPMLAPVPFELNPGRAAQTMAALPELRAMGFEVEPFGAAALLLKGAPAVFAPCDSRRLLSDMLDSMGENGFRLQGEGAMEEWLKTLACHGSLRVGRVLDMREISSLLEQLDRTEFKTNCPHGRPVHVEFRRTQLERMFRR
ncbi:MAG: DNA mismatch repair endonuclease MutL [Deltaproteobacteria bacterium]|nr:DNA mismatch repair endonuclease MutL [Deltaproteobacteria bacterium]